MTQPKPRIREAEIDAVLSRLLLASADATARFLSALPDALRAPVARIDSQTRHQGGSGTIDLDIHLTNGVRLLCENKIDAGWSVTAAGEAQPERYRRSVDLLRIRGIEAHSVLIAPEIYLNGSKRRAAFDHAVSYEAISEDGTGVDADLLRAAIVQARTLYEPEPNTRSGAFFTAYAAFSAAEFPSLVLKRDPNGGQVRPSGSRTIYFDAKGMLRVHPGVPLPRMSVQAWDSGAANASAKLMIGGWGYLAASLPASNSLAAIDAYLRPAGRSLGVVIDTPALDTQASFGSQVEAARAGLSAIEALAIWWNVHGGAAAGWQPCS